MVRVHKGGDFEDNSVMKIFWPKMVNESCLIENLPNIGPHSNFSSIRQKCD